MGRWRPPPPQSSPYITASGLAALKRELKHLWRTLRPEVVRALSAAAAEGDRSENAEYIYRKKQLGEIDRRVRYLTKRVDQVTPVSGQPSDSDKVFFGARVQVEDQSGARAGQVTDYWIVGADEIDARIHRISIDSPLARGLLGQTVDDEVVIKTPEGARELRVVSIDYPEH
ncbi:MAG: transcription elongation factor GreB [Pseudomonadota bacterium]